MAKANKKNPIKDEYIKLIMEHDKTLSLLRSQWMDAKPPEKTKYMDRINSALDERLRLMSIRDSK